MIFQYSRKNAAQLSSYTCINVDFVRRRRNWITKKWMKSHDCLWGCTVIPFSTIHCVETTMACKQNEFLEKDTVAEGCSQKDLGQCHVCDHTTYKVPPPRNFNCHVTFLHMLPLKRDLFYLQWASFTCSLKGSQGSQATIALSPFI